MTTAAYELKAEGIEEVRQGLLNAIKQYRRIVEVNFMTLGKRTAYFCRRELEDVRYTGKLERSFVSEIDAAKSELVVHPTAKHAKCVRTGTRPHWAPIGPLKDWARWKLGDAAAAYPVQRSIAAYGTSMYQLRKRGTKANPWPVRVVKRGDFRVALEATGGRIGHDLAGAVVGGGAQFI